MPAGSGVESDSHGDTIIVMALRPALTSVRSLPSTLGISPVEKSLKVNGVSHDDVSLQTGVGGTVWIHDGRVRIPVS